MKVSTLAFLIILAGCSGDSPPTPNDGGETVDASDAATQDAADTGALDTEVPVDVVRDVVLDGPPRCRFSLNGEARVHDVISSWRQEGFVGVLTCPSDQGMFGFALSAEDAGLAPGNYSCGVVDFENQITMTFHGEDGTVWAANGRSPEDPCAVSIAHVSSARGQGTFSGTLVRIRGETPPERFLVTDGVFDLPTSAL